MDDGSTLGSYATVESHEVLPQLPGYRTNAHKSGSKKQSLKYIEGQRYLLETGGPSAAKLSSSNSATSLTLSRGRVGEPAPTKPAFRFVLNSAQVLCFFGYFKEAVHESYLENHRIRKARRRRRRRRARDREPTSPPLPVFVCGRLRLAAQHTHAPLRSLFPGRSDRSRCTIT